MGFLRGNSLLKSGVTFDFFPQSKPLGGSTPQTPRWGRGAAPKPPRISFSVGCLQAAADLFVII
ncbi:MULTISPECIES: hypothetical protein [unclassified Microcystis]|uniref:Mobile element protein n=1 Tax=Microcystis flos-aquae Mf_QC_C_20070823_S10D TaxID=2486236 RepID=A0A552KJ49_9CHRO|nr:MULTISPECIES: hypothetical protein [unclassified Microcystis]TRT94018.1 MAG: hypothetical protein EWV65_17615 [Microcystis flos-aquae Ma_QC_C_20070823_S18D]TRV07986.1 MAG: hypothetical protein EWV45_18740 [Microcystis flos-aquae Mf_QC_C_20070823_S10D]TRV20094.1 MAG: hypothetical protein EWV72_19990 [Microcystis flos-aquae Mf_QC_C_20070823_S10]TRV28840.1 MAG: hypothetical protein EWV70_22580 [Microcystis flos-aquae Mf_QC_C_20070823_S20]TRV40038.1 MAG: hypothetical protein EWV44_05700 [Microc